MNDQRKVHAEAKKHAEHQRQALINQAKTVLIEQGDETIKKFPLIDRKSKFRNKKCPCGSGKKFKKCCW